MAERTQLHTGPQLHARRLRDVAAENSIQCVYLTCFHAEFSTLAILLQYSAIRIRRAETLEEAEFLLTVTGSTVLLTDITFLDGSWRDALAMAGEYPLLASVVAVDAADWPLTESYDRGACGALRKPLDLNQAVSLIRAVHEAVRERAFVLSGR